MSDPGSKAARVRLAVFDVDGVMTDGRLYLGPDGTELKVVHVHDGLGLQRLQAAGVAAAVISKRRSPAMAERFEHLGLTRVQLGVDDKGAAFAELLEAVGVAADDTAVMGDDLPDLPLMRQAGLALAVANAVPEVRTQADWVSAKSGGDGAVREACELIIAAREDIA